MTGQFDSFSQLLDVDWLSRKTVSLIGWGRIGGGVGQSLARTGVGTIIAVDNDIGDIRNVCFGFPLSGVGQPKVEASDGIFKDINQDLVYKPIVGKVTRDRIEDFGDIIGESDCIGLFADSFRSVSSLARFFYNKVPCVCALQFGDVGVAEVAFSFPHTSPCLECSMRLSNRIAGHGGQTLPDGISMVVTIATRYILGILLRGKWGYDYYRHYLDPSRCRGFLVNHDNDFLPRARDDFGCHYQFVQVVTAEHRPGCQVCRGYSLQPI